MSLDCNELTDNVFKPTRKKFYFGKLKHGTPYFYPWNFNENILTIRKLKLSKEENLEQYSEYMQKTKKFKNLPLVRRNKNKIVKLFNTYFYISIGSPIMFHKNGLGWKDKYNSPRYEWCPSFQIYFFHWQFCIFWTQPNECDIDNYWEMLLWYNYYSEKDLQKAEETWNWINYDTKLSTWDKNCLK